jgi:hypothetical protein
MKIADYSGYEIHLPTSGGKAGKGCQVTSALQIVRPAGNARVIVKQVRFILDNYESRRTAMQKVKDWCRENSL